MNKNSFDQMWLNILQNSNEMQKRQMAALKALELGWGGVSKVCQITGMSHNTVDKGIRELKQNKTVQQIRIRKVGGGRKKILDKNPEIRNELEKILRDNTAGDPMRFLIWTNKSLENISKELKRMKHKISRYTIRRILLKDGYTLQSNKKSKEYCNCPKRDSQFKYINSQIEEFEKRKQPIGLIICKTKDEETVHYALGDLRKDIFVSEYKTKLPSEEEIKKALAAKAANDGK